MILPVIKEALWFAWLLVTLYAITCPIAHATPSRGEDLVRLRFDIRLDDSLDEVDTLLPPQGCPKAEHVGNLKRMVSLIRRSSRLLYAGTGKRAFIDDVRIFLPFHWPRDNLPEQALQCAGESDLGHHAVTIVPGRKIADTSSVCGDGQDVELQEVEHASGNHSLERQILRVPLSLVTSCNVSLDFPLHAHDVYVCHYYCRQSTDDRFAA